MNTKKEHGKIDWMITLVPLAIVIALCVLFFFAPEQSNAVLSQIRFFFGDTFGTYYLVIGLGIFILSWVWKRREFCCTVRMHEGYAC